jgi:GNAT superfamily N-acetyltransferase
VRAGFLSGAPPCCDGASHRCHGPGKPSGHPRILSLLAWTGEDDHVERIVSPYSKGSHRLLAYAEADRVLGVIDIETGPDERGIIRHIAVTPSAQGRGIGLLMVEGAAAHVRQVCGQQTQHRDPRPGSSFPTPWTACVGRWLERRVHRGRGR